MELPFLPRREKFLLLEVLPGRIDGYFLSVDAEKRIRLDRVVRGVTPKRLAAFAMMHRPGSQVIVSAHPSLVATAVLPVQFVRKNALTPLEPRELEDLLSQFVSRAFNQVRVEASRDLQVDDMDALLVNSQVLNFKIDGHHVLNPIGFRAQKIDAVLELTLTTRTVFEELKGLLRNHRSFFFAEMDRAQLVGIQKVAPMPLTLLVLEEAQARFFMMQKAAIGYMTRRGHLAWHGGVFRDLISEAFTVPPAAAHRIYQMYIAGDLSPAADKYLKKILKPAEERLFAELTKARFGLGGVYIQTRLPLPFVLPHRAHSITLSEPPVAALLEKLGVSFDEATWPIPPARTFAHLAPFLEFYFYKNDSPINQWLRRHLNWLGASLE